MTYSMQHDASFYKSDNHIPTHALTASPCSWDHSNLHDHSASASTHQGPALLWLSHQLQTRPPSEAHRGHLQWQTWEVSITRSGWSTVQQSSKLCTFMHTCVPLYNMHKCHNIAKQLNCGYLDVKENKRQECFSCYVLVTVTDSKTTGLRLDSLWHAHKRSSLTD